MKRKAILAVWLLSFAACEPTPSPGAKAHCAGALTNGRAYCLPGPTEGGHCTNFGCRNYPLEEAEDAASDGEAGLMLPLADMGVEMPATEAARPLERGSR